MFNFIIYKLFSILVKIIFKLKNFVKKEKIKYIKHSRHLYIN